MKKHFLLLPALLLIFSCGNNTQKIEADRIKDSLNAVNGNLRGDVGRKDSTIDSFIQSFNQIQDNLDQIKEKEKLITTETKSGDTKNKQDKIISDIQLIYNLLAENKGKIAMMSAKLKKADTKYAELEKMVDHLNAQLEEKDVQIGDLKDHLEKMKIDLTNLQTDLEASKQESGSKTEKMNTVYYVSGTSKELVKQGVLTKEGGFIGLGKTAELRNNFNKDCFTRLDASMVTEIPLGRKKAKVLTPNPTSAYKFEGEQGKKIDKLVITNPADFWGTSKYLVIIVD